jgi:hypothetical protein
MRTSIASLTASLLLAACGGGGPDTSTPTTAFTISGRISGDAVAGVTVTLSGAASATTTTDPAGKYDFRNLTTGQYEVTPSLAGYVFFPASVQVPLSGAGADVNVFASNRFFRISGTVSGDIQSGVSVWLAWKGPRQPRTWLTWTDAAGAYGFDVFADDDYTVTPFHPYATFSPSSAQVTVRGADAGGGVFTASALGPICSADGWCWESPFGFSGDEGFDVWGSSAADVWLVGGSYGPMHWNGSAWTNAPAHNSGTLVSVWGSSASSVWAAGDAISRWNGDAWVVEASATNGNDFFEDIWGSSASDVWAVGFFGGTILHWNGSSWSGGRTYLAHGLFGVWGASANDVWAAGEVGTILHWNGSAWTSVPSGTTQILRGVWGSSASDVWVVGEAGTTLHWDGGAWTSVPSGTTSHLFRAWGTSANDVWAVGTAGTILHWNGSAWSNSASGTTQILRGVWGSSASDVWVVGHGGVVLRYRP